MVAFRSYRRSLHATLVFQAQVEGVVAAPTLYDGCFSFQSRLKFCSKYALPLSVVAR